MTKRSLGVCYYPEHWPEERWADDARRMADAGLSHARIGEFAWSRLEPTRGDLRFDWLERAIDTLHGSGLKVVLGTPTATPPRWLVDEMPDMLPLDREGRVRTFGSRRHYCFSHRGYREACIRIVTALAERFGEHPAVVAWQVDNEYGCHDTVLSYSDAASRAFRRWLEARYDSPEALNWAWGNVFWSMEVASFEEVDLPDRAVTECNPAHSLAFRRFSSDQVLQFHQAQVEVLRGHSPGRPIVHNFMGRSLGFDHFALGAELDISAWDSYPLGFLEDRSDRDEAWKSAFVRAGDPDFQAFHHDLYRATSGGRWWVMEQQPGPVNWAPYNPVPRPGMVRLWTWEAFAHGAELVSYFRWRQAPFAQEQMHAGLLRPDAEAAPGLAEAAQVAREIAALDLPEPAPADAAIVFDYDSVWAWEIQPQGRGFDHFRLIFEFYRMLRRLGVSVDIRSADTDDLSSYRLVLMPGLFAWSESLKKALRALEGVALIGPRTGSRTRDFAIPEGLPPGLPRDMLDLAVSRVETLRPDATVPWVGEEDGFTLWREHIEPGPRVTTVWADRDGAPALLRQDRLFYLAGWPQEAAMRRLLTNLCEEVGIAVSWLPEGLRFRRCSPLTVVVNYGEESVTLEEHGLSGTFRLGGPVLEPSGVAVIEAAS